jgi:hypothetical protein
MSTLHQARKIALVVLALAGCGSENDGKAGQSGSDGGAGECTPPNRLVGDACREPGVQDDGCPAGKLGLEDASCRAAGIPAAMCGEGFQPDGDVGCIPILPAEPCPPGLMAIPGETRCREVAPCGDGRWGAIPVEPDTVFVDATYTGGGSDGSPSKPWTTIQSGIDAAAAGAIVAVAAGSYVEDVAIAAKPVRLCGRCPALVEVVGSASALAAIDIEEGAGGTEVCSLAVRGAAVGIRLSGSQGVLVDRVWIHDTASRGLNVHDPAGPTGIALRGALIERTREVGIFVLGSDATLEATVVRDTQPRASDQRRGRGISVQDDADTGRRSSLGVHASVFERNRSVGVFVGGSDATVDATVVQGTQPEASDGTSGRGIGIQYDPITFQRSSVTVRSSFVYQNHEVGVFVSGSDATIEATVVHDTQPEASDQTSGEGVTLQASDDGTERTRATISSSLIAQSREVGVFVNGSDATIEATVVRDTQPQASNQRFGRGIHVQVDPRNGAVASAVIRTSVIERSFEFGIAVSTNDAIPSEVTGCLVRGTLPNVDGRFGDGISSFADGGPGALFVTTSRIEDSARAGISAFGARMSIGASVVQCASFDLASEPFDGAPSDFEDQGGNVCGCPSADGACLLETLGIEPPEPVAPIE